MHMMALGFPFGSLADLTLSRAAAVTSHFGALTLAAFAIGTFGLAAARGGARTKRGLFWGTVLMVSAGAAHALAAGWMTSSQTLLTPLAESSVSAQARSIDAQAVAEGVAAMDLFEGR
jgi:hypothetical protein